MRKRGATGSNLWMNDGIGEPGWARCDEIELPGITSVYCLHREAMRRTATGLICGRSRWKLRGGKFDRHSQPAHTRLRQTLPGARHISNPPLDLRIPQKNEPIVSCVFAGRTPPKATYNEQRCSLPAQSSLRHGTASERILCGNPVRARRPRGHMVPSASPTCSHTNMQWYHYYPALRSC